MIDAPITRIVLAGQPALALDCLPELPSTPASLP